MNDDTQGYHETITRVFLHGVRLFLAEADPDDELHELVNDLLLSPMGRRDWPLRFYSAERLFSVEARRKFVTPDLGGAALRPHGNSAFRRRDIVVDVLGEHVHRDVAALDHRVVEVAQVVARAERRLGPFALADDLAVADLVAAGLARASCNSGRPRWPPLRASSR